MTRIAHKRDLVEVNAELSHLDILEGMAPSHGYASDALLEFAYQEPRVQGLLPQVMANYTAHQLLGLD